MWRFAQPCQRRPQALPAETSANWTACISQARRPTLMSEAATRFHPLAGAALRGAFSFQSRRLAGLLDPGEDRASRPKSVGFCAPGPRGPWDWSRNQENWTGPIPDPAQWVLLQRELLGTPSEGPRGKPIKTGKQTGKQIKQC